MTTRALSLALDDIETLGASWMPQLENGGLFMPTRDAFHLGQRVYLLLSLPGEQERRPVSGVVAWVSPVGMTGRRTPGIGIHLDAEEQPLRVRIEALLTEAPPDTMRSYTL
ncbi:PilZ domain-containing protein [Kushneria aurantia]|uniref:PilZ domain-containing protein n=1 Tax=Kushneria aurantia TaxID=504092 RepID=A0ABV6G6V5_9GAMM|nr:PilZ domain-containing protein [Kushneria aurantia]